MAPPRLSRYESRIVADVVRLILPEYPPLDSSVREEVSVDVTSYVASQIRSMPSFLAHPYRLALLAFDLLPLLRYGRTFHSLPYGRKHAYLAGWSDAPIGVMRDFVKLIRSCALLAYFDHPRVGAELEAERQPRAAAAMRARHRG